jgi:NTE family protein
MDSRRRAVDTTVRHPTGGGATLDGPLAFVLSGGANRGAIHAGALLAVIERGIFPDLVVGTSVGALNAACLAWRPDLERARELVEIWTRMPERDLFSKSVVRRLMNLVRFRDRLLSPAPLIELISELEYTRIEQAAIPLIVVATDLRTGEEVRFREGDVMPALLASTAMPGLLPPVDVDGRLCVDGGVTSHSPIAAAIEAGARRCLVFDLLPPLECGPSGLSPLSVMMRAINIGGRQRTLAELACPPAGVVIEHLALACDKPIRLDDLSHCAELIGLGHALATEALSRREVSPETNGIDGISS